MDYAPLRDKVAHELRAAGLGPAIVVGARGEALYEEVIVALGSMRLRFLRDRSQDFLELGSAAEPGRFFYFDHVEVAMGWRTVDPIMDKWAPDELGDVIARFKSRQGELDDAFSRVRWTWTAATLERAKKACGDAMRRRFESIGKEAKVRHARAVARPPGSPSGDRETTGAVPSRPRAPAADQARGTLQDHGLLDLGFADAVGKRFVFLRNRGFSMVESSPTIVRYKKGDIEVNVYHGRRSHELGFDVVRREVSYSIWQLIRAIDPEALKTQRVCAATTREAVERDLDILEALATRYAPRALEGDEQLFAALDAQDEQLFAALDAQIEAAWTAYVMDLNAPHVRPEAEAAFRSGDYRLAAELYEKIRPCLSSVELKKLELAKKRAGP